MAANASIWEAPDGSDWAIWAENSTTYDVALLAPNGGGKEATALHWAGGGIANNPVLVSNGTEPLLIFGAGGPPPYNTGALVGFVPSKWGALWTGLSWSLSNSTIIDGYFGAARNSAGELSAAWNTVGPYVSYRIGTAATIPAPPPDQQFTFPNGYVGFINEAVDPSNDDFYAAFARYFTKPSSTDGVYVADLTTHGGITKAPGSGTESVSRESLAVAFAASTGKHGGLFAVYCDNTGSCNHLLFWRVGSPHALVVPGSTAQFPGDWPALAAGPDGRMWIAWFNGANSMVYTVRTNEADTRFGPVESYDDHLVDLNNIAVSGGGAGRLDVVLGGLISSNLKPEILTTQSLTGLQLSPGSVSFHNTTTVKVVFTVTDAGDPVAGATVTVAGQSGTTDAGGAVTFAFPKGISPGKYAATAMDADYFSGHASVVVLR
ncbi:MAG TPA: hypothetical protein VEH29_15525 [Acidimicrobiales bacterium]|nr:hypothetical protein [Acidimicrobiales bacterium]